MFYTFLFYVQYFLYFYFPTVIEWTEEKKRKKKKKYAMEFFHVSNTVTLKQIFI